MESNMHFWSYLAQFLEWEMIETKVVENIKPLILCSITFSRKSFRLWNDVKKRGRVRRVTDDNMAHSLFSLGTQGYTHTHTQNV
jgi:hypothetical protein